MSTSCCELNMSLPFTMLRAKLISELNFSYAVAVVHADSNVVSLSLTVALYVACAKVLLVFTQCATPG